VAAGVADVDAASGRSCWGTGEWVDWAGVALSNRSSDHGSSVRLPVVQAGKHLPWVATQQVTAHWLRHTTLTWVERNFGSATARAYAGHTG